MGAARNLPHNLAATNEAAVPLGIDHIVDAGAILAGCASEVTIGWSHNLKTQTLKDSRRFESISGDVLVTCGDDQSPAMIGSVGDASQHVDVEVAYAGAALAVDVGEYDGRGPTMKSDPAPDTSRVISDAVVLLARLQLHDDVLPDGRKNSNRKARILDNRWGGSRLEAVEPESLEEGRLELEDVIREGGHHSGNRPGWLHRRD